MLLLGRSLHLGCQRDDRRLVARPRDELHTVGYAGAVDSGGHRHRWLPGEVPGRRVGDPRRAAQNRADAAAMDGLAEPRRRCGGPGREDDVDVVEDAVDALRALRLARDRAVGELAKALADPHDRPRPRLQPIPAAPAVGGEITRPRGSSPSGPPRRSESRYAPRA